MRPSLILASGGLLLASSRPAAAAAHVDLERFAAPDALSLPDVEGGGTFDFVPLPGTGALCLDGSTYGYLICRSPQATGFEINFQVRTRGVCVCFLSPLALPPSPSSSLLHLCSPSRVFIS